MNHTSRSSSIALVVAFALGGIGCGTRSSGEGQEAAGLNEAKPMNPLAPMAVTTVYSAGRDGGSVTRAFSRARGGYQRGTFIDRIENGPGGLRERNGVYVGTKEAALRWRKDVIGASSVWTSEAFRFDLDTGAVRSEGGAVVFGIAIVSGAYRRHGDIHIPGVEKIAHADWVPNVGMPYGTGETLFFRATTLPPLLSVRSLEVTDGGWELGPIRISDPATLKIFVADAETAALVGANPKIVDEPASRRALETGWILQDRLTLREMAAGSW